LTNLNIFNSELLTEPEFLIPDHFMNQNLAIGADIGGSHISCAAVDLTTGKVLKETLSGRPVDSQAQASRIISVWTEALNEVLSKVERGEVRGIGFAMPGPFDYVKGISYIKGVSKYENLYGFNIGDAIHSHLDAPQNLGIRFMNDASSFAVGEAWGGKAAGAYRSMSITLGTGFGSAFIENKIPVVDGPDVPKLGCVYHLPFNGKIADESFTTRWFISSYKSISGKEVSGVRELAELAKDDDKARNLFTEYGNNMGIFIAPWLNRFKAEVLVIGGNISYAYNLFGEVFENKLKSEKCSCRIEISDLKEDAALIGSAYLFDESFWKSVQHALPLM
jgi:glucokinase